MNKILLNTYLYNHLKNRGADMTQFEEANPSEIKKCPMCSASLKEYWHPITPLLANALVKAYRYISKAGENKFGRGEIELSMNEYSNFTKLRFHGLIAKYKTEGVHEKGYWLITTNGAKFLKGEYKTYKRVKTFRNRVQDHEPPMVSIADVIGSQPYLDKDPEYTLRDLRQGKLL